MSHSHAVGRGSGSLLSLSVNPIMIGSPKIIRYTHIATAKHHTNFENFFLKNIHKVA